MREVLRFKADVGDGVIFSSPASIKDNPDYRLVLYGHCERLAIRRMSKIRNSSLKSLLGLGEGKLIETSDVIQSAWVNAYQALTDKDILNNLMESYRGLFPDDSDDGERETPYPTFLAFVAGYGVSKAISELRREYRRPGRQPFHRDNLIFAPSHMSILFPENRIYRYYSYISLKLHGAKGEVKYKHIHKADGEIVLTDSRVHPSVKYIKGKAVGIEYRETISSRYPDRIPTAKLEYRSVPSQRRKELEISLSLYERYLENIETRISDVETLDIPSPYSDIPPEYKEISFKIKEYSYKDIPLDSILGEGRRETETIISHKDYLGDFPLAKLWEMRDKARDKIETLKRELQSIDDDDAIPVLTRGDVKIVGQAEKLTVRVPHVKIDKGDGDYVTLFDVIAIYPDDDIISLADLKRGIPYLDPDMVSLIRDTARGELFKTALTAIDGLISHNRKAHNLPDRIKHAIARIIVNYADGDYRLKYHDVKVKSRSGKVVKRSGAYSALRALGLSQNLARSLLKWGRREFHSLLTEIYWELRQWIISAAVIPDEDG